MKNDIAVTNRHLAAGQKNAPTCIRSEGAIGNVSDQKFKNRASDHLLQHAVFLVREDRFSAIHLTFFKHYPVRMRALPAATAREQSATDIFYKKVSTAWPCFSPGILIRSDNYCAKVTSGTNGPELGEKIWFSVSIAFGEINHKL